MTSRPRIPAATQCPRRVRLPEGTLVLPPVTLQDLPPGGVAALRFSAAVGTVAVFLHDLDGDDIALILRAQRREAEAQLGENYGRRALWWEKP